MNDRLAPPLDVHRLVAVLGATGSEFVIVGSAAAWMQGASRRPRDLDIVIRDDRKNFEAIANMLHRVHARPIVRGLSDEEARLLPTRIDALVVAELPISMWMTAAGELDLFDALSHSRNGERTYQQLLEASTPRCISGVTAPVASIDDLIGAKQFANRGGTDSADLEELAKVREVQARSRTPPLDRATRRWGVDL